MIVPVVGPSRIGWRRSALAGLLLAVCLYAGLGSGCADPRSRICEAELAQKLVEGHSTKADAVELFGEPEDVARVSDGSEVWKYEYARTLPSARLEVGLLLTPVAVTEATVRVCHLHLEFTKSDVLVRKAQWIDAGEGAQ